MATFYGAKVTLITSIESDYEGIDHVIPVQTVLEMKSALESEIRTHDCLYMAAAVSDYTIQKSKTKINREKALTLQLTGTPDLLQSIASLKKDKTYIGFCLADTDLEKIAEKKRVKKGLDYIVANTSDNIGQDKRTFMILSKDKNQKPISYKKNSLLETAYELIKLCP